MHVKMILHFFLANRVTREANATLFIFDPITSSQNGPDTDLLFNPDIIETNLNDATLLDITSLDFENEFDTHYGLLAPEQTVIVRAYSDNSDDQVLKLSPNILLYSSLVRTLFDVLR
jgi:hypothetical protein